jgi:predicted nucleic acid-binding protein
MESSGPVTIHLDTSVLLDALTGPRRSLRPLERAVSAGHVINISALVFYEWRRGPRTKEELADQELLLPAGEAREFGPSEAAKAADIYRTAKRARGRDMDIAIAACAIQHRARLWTLNPDDFRDLPGVELYDPRRP